MLPFSSARSHPEQQVPARENLKVSSLEHRARRRWYFDRCLFALMLAVVLTACNPGMGIQWTTVEGPVNPILILAAADATRTPTPFQPLSVTPTFIPTSLPTSTLPATPVSQVSPTPQVTTIPPTSQPKSSPTADGARTWDDYPGPSVWPDVAVPPPTGVLAQPEGQVNILLLGSDQRSNDYGFRTDTIQLLTLTPSQGSVTLTSFPRDLYVYIPGWTVQRINTAFAQRGFEGLALTMEYNFGVRPDHYVMINFWSFEAVIDNLGGIVVNVAKPLTDHRDDYGQFTIYAGEQKMDGETALWYVRSRYSTSDFDRGRRQQEVLEGMLRKMLSLDGISRAPQLYDLYRKNVETDMSFDDMAAFLPLAAQLNSSEKMRRFNIGGQEVSDFINSYGSQVLLPNREAILKIMRQALNTP